MKKVKVREGIDTDVIFGKMGTELREARETRRCVF